MNKIYNKTLVSLFIICQPLIDILTYFSNSKFGFSIGLIIRGLFIVYSIIYLIFVTDNKKIKILFPLIMFIYLLFYFCMNCSGIGIFLYKIPSLFKFLYFPITMIFMLDFYHLKLKKNLIIVATLICFFMLISQLIGNVVISYDSAKLGNSGWFFSTNEFSSICSILFPLVFFYFIENLNKYGFILTILFAICMLLIGTKSSYLAIAITLFSSLLFIIYKIVLKREKYLKQLLCIIIFSVIFIIITPYTYSYKNMYIVESANTNEFLLNGRDEILETNLENIKTSSNTFNIFTGIHLNQKINYEFERDFYNIYYNYGVLGILLYFSVPLYILVKQILLVIKKKRINISFTKCAAIISILISMGLAYISGHTLLSPAVSFYIVLLILILIYKNENDKKKVMFISSVGGHLTQLLELSQIFANYDYVLVTEKTNITKVLKDKYNINFLIYGSRKYLFKYLFIFGFNILKSIYLFIIYTPEVIVTTGTHTSVPMCYIGWLFNKKIIYIESFAKRKSGTLSGKLVYPIATTFVVQWESMLKIYPKAEYWGGIY